ncbi:FMN-binding protein [Nocardioides korecus]
MKRISLWLLATLSVLVLLFGYSTSTSGPSAATSGSSYEATTGSSGSSSGSTSSGSTSSGSGSTSSGSTSSGSASSGSTGSGSSTASKTVTGSVAQTQWGPVQVTVTVAGGKITRVDVPVYPSGNGKDAEINSYALPVLTQETVKAQSASIDMVSGATVTSNGYLESLQSALDKAGL